MPKENAHALMHIKVMTQKVNRYKYAADATSKPLTCNSVHSRCTISTGDDVVTVVAGDGVGDSVGVFRCAHADFAVTTTL